MRKILSISILSILFSVATSTTALSQDFTGFTEGGGTVSLKVKNGNVVSFYVNLLALCIGNYSTGDYYGLFGVSVPIKIKRNGSFTLKDYVSHVVDDTGRITISGKIKNRSASGRVSVHFGRSKGYYNFTYDDYDIDYQVCSASSSWSATKKKR